MLFKEFVDINPKVSLKKGESYPYVEMADVNPSRGYVTNSKSREYKSGGAKFEDGDTLFARITPCLENGKISRFKSNGIKKGFGSTEFFVFRAKKSLSDPDFIYYLSKSHLIKRTAEKSMSGASGRQRADISAVEEVEIDPPSIDTQQKIASILSAFDDLIENNTRRIAILEEMAWLIYREWFVHYRYPGHENDRLVDSGTELGEVPEGWVVAPFDDYLEVLSGGTPKTKVEEYWNGDIPFFTPKDATDLPFVLEAVKSITQNGLQKCSSKLYEPYTVFITARGTVGKLNMPIYPMAMNQSCYALRAKQDSGLSQFFIYYALHEKVEALQKRAHGAVFDTIIKDTFKQLKGVFPNKKLVEDFDSMVTPILKKIEVLMVKNKKLKETRDLLLPKLISGKVGV